GGFEAIVRRPAISAEEARVIGTENRFDDIETPARLDHVERGARAHEGPEPLGVPADFPAGLVRIDEATRSHELVDPLVERLGFASHTQERAPERRAVHRQSEGVAEEPRDLAVRGAECLVEVDCEGNCRRPDLVRRGSESVGDLLRVTSLDATATSAALGNVDVELSDRGLDLRDLGEELLFDAMVLELLAAAERAGAVVEGRLEDSVDLFRSRSEVTLAVAPAGLPSRLFRVLLGLSLRERSRLPLPCPQRLVKLLTELLVLALQPLDPFLALRAALA